MTQTHSPEEKVLTAANDRKTTVVEPQPAKNQWLSGGRGVILGVGLGLILAFVGGRILTSDSANDSATPAPVATAEAKAKSVTVAEVDPTAIAQTLAATGTVTAYEMIPVTSQATGLQITAVLVDEGDTVRAGQTLVRLDDAALRAQLAQANAAVQQAEARVAELRAGSRSEEIAQAQAQVSEAQARADLAQERARRFSSLRNDGAIAQDQLDEVLTEQRQANASLQQTQRRLEELQAGPRPEAIAQAQAQLNQAQAQVRLATAQLNDTVVRAPKSGQIAERNASVGDLTSSSNQLFQIIQNGRLELQLNVPETQLPQIKPGQTVQITNDADADFKITGKVREIDPLIDAESRQATVKVDVPSNPNLKPGMFLRAEIATKTAPGLTVPTDAIIPQSDGSGTAFVVQSDNTVKAQTVETGKILSDNRIEIRNGLNPGDKIVVKGAPYLKEGDRVSVTN
ncbi:MAG: efflux RND transporter periplasmic adaptor subunit [Jaaginema sp. PMC 1079.18]|nr:efflux RND transporter periplasmic adaptor subunit [Jaaginema sp. PMC 1080.18]MEC4850968.1 efflux RND transporter periplasmic adaptor subunit [Jaaginema sp. PMC 1079.18]MEC4866231.1 efflux RND transporter periplasmic adaptor subunit [Jaaginema sp. PMC 1078.18]